MRRQPEDALIVQTLWMGGPLTRVERLSLVSFLRTGHAVDLYAYDDVPNVPEGARLLDANRIVTRAELPRYGPRAGEGAGSWALASDIFRYALLWERGGWWVDTDVVALRSLDDDHDYFFAFQDERMVNTAVLKMPAHCQLAELLADTSRRLGANAMWAEPGPCLMTTLVSLMAMTDLAAGPGTVYPVHWSQVLDLLRPDPLGVRWRRLASSHAVHLWNEMWRRLGIDKERTHARTSIFERLCRRYGASVT